MAGVLPKISLFIFISIIVLLINLSICTVAMMENSVNYTDYTNTQTEEIQGNEVDTGNVTLGNFALATGSAFVPYVSLVSLAILGLDGTISLFVGLVITILSSLQVLLLVLIVLNMAPKVLGSGFDV